MKTLLVSEAPYDAELGMSATFWSLSGIDMMVETRIRPKKNGQCASQEQMSYLARYYR